MKVKGSALVTIPLFIRKTFGEDEVNRWLDSLSPECREIFTSPILSSSWYPIKAGLSNPTLKLCELFYDGSLEGAWENGRFSAEYSLKGIYKVFIRIASPHFLIKQASTILPTYYEPCEIEASEKEKNQALIRITRFDEMDKVLENRIGGWVEKALEICGCKELQVSVTKSLVDNDPYTEFIASWS